MRANAATMLALSAVLLGCGSSGSTTTDTGLTIASVAGDAQSGAPGVALPVALQVVVHNATGGAAAGQVVTWSATGDAQVVPATTTTDGAGNASATLVFGATAGAAGATATLANGKSSTFTATSTGTVSAVTIDVLDGNGQFAAGGSALPKPLRAIVHELAGTPSAGRLVHWTVTSGSGHLASTFAITGADGIATGALIASNDLSQAVSASTLGANGSAAFSVAGFAAPISIVIFSPISVPDTTCVALHKHVSLSVTDSLGRFMKGLTVKFAISGIGIAGALDSATTNNVGIAQDTLVLSTAPGTTTIQVSTSASSAAASVQFVTQSPCASVFNAYVNGAGTTVSPGVRVPVLATVTNDSGVQPSHLVTWTVLSGGGSVSPSTTPAGGPDEATTFIPGPATGVQVVRASTPGFAPVDLTFTVLPGTPVLVATVPMPTGATYDHDAFVRDGIAFVFAWNKGVLIYDVGNGTKSGTPSNPQLISSLVTSDNGVAGGPAVHNGWWFQNPVTGQKKYLFVGQEGPGTIGTASTGDIHIVDVSDLAHPTEVGFIHIPGAGTHNFWMDEANQVLYAAYYNAGVVKIDVSGTLSGDMSSRIMKQVQPGGPGHTYTWGVMLANGTLYASDMVSGFWALDPVTLSTKGGGNNLPPNFGFGSDLWVAGNVGYSGNWSNGDGGARIAIWSLNATGVPTLANTLVSAGTTMSDVAVSPDGKMLVGTTEGGNNGLYVWDRTDPIHPVLAAFYPVAEGLHTAETKVVNGRTYVFAARDPNMQQLMIFDITDVVH